MDTIVTILTPLIVAGATWLVRTLGPKIPGVLIVGVVVPILSALVTVASHFAGASTNVITQIVIGLVAVFIAEVVKQFKQGSTP